MKPIGDINANVLLFYEEACNANMSPSDVSVQTLIVS